MVHSKAHSQERHWRMKGVKRRESESPNLDLNSQEGQSAKLQFLPGLYGGTHLCKSVSSFVSLMFGQMGFKVILTTKLLLMYIYITGNEPFHFNMS